MIHLHEKNQERKRLNGLIAKSAMKVPAAVGEVGKRVFADGALSKKHNAEIAETLDIGAIMGGTISMKSVRHAFAVVDDIKKGQAP